MHVASPASLALRSLFAWSSVMHKLTISIRKFFENKEGATMVEYGLMVALIAVVCLTAVSLLGTNLRAIFDQIAAAV
jgi:pilus assembly protein Flp/PilA